MKSVTSAWLAAAKDDLLSISEIQHNEQLTNIVAFHAQQAIEKSFKAMLEERDGTVPKIHSLETLFSKVLRHIRLDEVDSDLLEELDKLYIDSRYPGDFGLLPNGKPTIDEAAGFNEIATLIFTAISDAL